MNYQDHYRVLFQDVRGQLGDLDERSSTGIVGFSAGGPVSIKRTRDGAAYVTCELSLYPEQFRSSEREKFELLTRLQISEAEARALLSAVGRLSMEATLGHGHTVDVSAISGIRTLKIVRLTHFSSAVIEEQMFGVYELCERE